MQSWINFQGFGDYGAIRIAGNTMMASLPKISVITSLFQSNDFLEHYFENILEQSFFSDCEFVFLANDADRLEKTRLENFQKKFPKQVQVQFIMPLENLGASWNRGWQAAQARYIALWNVDDRRHPDSLAAQYEAMEAHPQWSLCYGDYLLVGEYGQEHGKLRKTPQYSRKRFRRAYPQGGAFWLMRKNIAEKIGYFDEQFHVGPDLDMSIRLAEASYEMGRIEQMLGYFTDAEMGLSTRGGGWNSSIDRTAIQLRYGIFDKVRNEYVKAAQKYRLDEILIFGNWQPLKDFLPKRSKFEGLRKLLWVIAFIRNGSRKLLKKLGLLDVIYALQKRFIGREI